MYTESIRIMADQVFMEQTPITTEQKKIVIGICFVIIGIYIISLGLSIKYFILLKNKRKSKQKQTPKQKQIIINNFQTYVFVIAIIMCFINFIIAIINTIARAYYFEYWIIFIVHVLITFLNYWKQSKFVSFIWILLNVLYLIGFSISMVYFFNALLS